MTAKVQSNLILYQRSIERASSTALEIELIEEIVQRTFFFAVYLSMNFKMIFKNSQDLKIGPTTKISFMINKEILIKILSDDQELRADRRFSQKMCKRVKEFLVNCDLSAQPRFTDPHLDHSKMQNPEATHLFRELRFQYRIFKKFEKIEIKSYEKPFSCVTYVISSLGLIAPFHEFVRSHPQNHRFKNHLDFLMLIGFQFSAAPIQSGDVLFSYSEKREITHAALADKNPQKVIAKLGNKTPFAFRHDFDETLMIYGRFLGILRRHYPIRKLSPQRPIYPAKHYDQMEMGRLDKPHTDR